MLMAKIIWEHLLWFRVFSQICLLLIFSVENNKCCIMNAVIYLESNLRMYFHSILQWFDCSIIKSEGHAVFLGTYIKNMYQLILICTADLYYIECGNKEFRAWFGYSDASIQKIAFQIKLEITIEIGLNTFILLLLLTVFICLFWQGD